MASPRVLIHGQTTAYADEIRAALDDRLDGGIDLIQSEREETHSRIAEADIVLTFDLDVDELENATRLKWVQALNAGVDQYPLAAMRERGITLTTASGVHADPIGEQVLGYLLLFQRRIIEGLRQQREGEWAPYGGAELRDGTVGIVGVGAIGERVATLGDRFGMEVLGVKRDVSSVPEAVDEIHPPDRLREVLPRSDYLVIACPLTEDTRHLIGAEELRSLPDDGVLINIARGEIVDEEALVEAIRARTIRGAALDVFETEPLPADSPLRELRPVVTTPHVAGSTPHYIERAMDIFVENYRAFRADRPLANRVI